MTLRLILSAPASRDIDEILAYLLGKSGDTRAQHVLDGLYASFGKLTASPNLGHRREDLTSSPILFYRVWSWFIVYRFDKSSLEVARVLHAARDIETLLREEPV